MKLPRLKMLLGFLLATFLTAPAWGAGKALPGTLNYIEGQASVGGEVLGPKSIGSVAIEPGQSLTTGNGKAEILLTPGVFLRVGDDSTVKMISSNLTNTAADLVKGQATVEIAEIHQFNQLRIDEDGASTYMLKNGLYAFDANQDQVRVLKGEAMVQDSDQNVKVKGGREVDLNKAERLQARKFDKNLYQTSDLYRFSYLRSSYLAEANVDIARTYYAGGPGWYGPGWYWDPWFWSYTWLSGNGILYSPFGWGFYSPWYVGYAPIYYGGYGYRGPYGFRNYARAATQTAGVGVRTGRTMPAMPSPRSNFGVAGPSFRGGGEFGGGSHH